MWRSGTLTLFVASFTPGVAQNLLPFAYPLHPGDTWIYQKESRSGYMARPSIERWTTEETVVSAVAVSELAGTLIAKRTKVLTHTVPPDFIPQNDSTKRELPESHILLHRSCVYLLDGIDAQGGAWDAQGAARIAPPLGSTHRITPEFRDALLNRKIPPDFCFPMSLGQTWGKVPTTSPANEWVWNVKALNGDPYGPPHGTTFRLFSHLASGTFIERWFAQGVGVVQEIIEHHGTYEESRRQLLRATIDGKTQSYRLTPARAVPLSGWDCQGPGWRHFARANGSSFISPAECIGSLPSRDR